MKKPLIFLAIVFSLMVGWTACNKTEDSNRQLLENEFLVEPSVPSTTQEVKVITYDCKYDQFGYINKKGFNIEVVKHFNSMMKLPCVLDYDTISLGKLIAGTYQLTFTIVDRSTMLLGADSISSTQTQVLVVKN